MQENNPLWNHSHSAKLQSAASNLFEAWRAGENYGWFLCSSHDSGLQIFQKQKLSGDYISKGTLLLPFSVTMITEEINKRESKTMYEADTINFKRLAQYSKGSGVDYKLFKTPWLEVSPRDVVVVYGTCQTNSKNVVLCPITSIVFPNCPPKSGSIRAEVNFGGWVFEVKSPNLTVATYMLDVDTRGSVPNYLSENAVMMPLNLCKFLQVKYGSCNSDNHRLRQNLIPKMTRDQEKIEYE